MSHNLNCSTSCPSPVPVTINTEVHNLYFDSASASFRSQVFGRSLGTITDWYDSRATLLLDPPLLQAGSIHILRIVSGVTTAMKPYEDFAVSGSRIFFADAIGVNDLLVVHWLSRGPEEQLDTPTGTLRGFSVQPTTGWLKMDGTTSHAIATYTTLWTVIQPSTGLYTQPVDSDHFTLASVTFPFFNGTSMENLQGYIRV